MNLTCPSSCPSARTVVECFVSGVDTGIRWTVADSDSQVVGQWTKLHNNEFNRTIPLPGDDTFKIFATPTSGQSIASTLTFTALVEYEHHEIICENMYNATSCLVDIIGACRFAFLGNQNP